MKKLLALLLAVVCLFACVSCTPAPKKDLAAAKSNLEAKNYVVFLDDTTDDPTVSETLTATNVNESLYIVRYASNKLAKLALRRAEAQIDAQIEDIKLEIKSIKHIMNKFDDELTTDEMDDYKEELRELEEELEEIKNVVFGRSGKLFWYGTKQAIKDSKK